MGRGGVWLLFAPLKRTTRTMLAAAATMEAQRRQETKRCLPPPPKRGLCRRDAFYLAMLGTLLYRLVRWMSMPRGRKAEKVA